MIDPENVGFIAWSKDLFASIADGGQWGVPRSGMIFTRRGETLVLTAVMPHDPEMEITADELVEQQEDEYENIRKHFEAAGITVTREVAA